MNIKDRIFGFNARNMYFALPGTQRVEYKVDPLLLRITRNYLLSAYSVSYFSKDDHLILVKQIGKNEFQDIFSKQKYRKFGEYSVDDNEVVHFVKSIEYKKARIKYKDAEKMLEEKNSLIHI